MDLKECESRDALMKAQLNDSPISNGDYGLRILRVLNSKFELQNRREDGLPGLVEKDRIV